jgi:hypothetical protein
MLSDELAPALFRAILDVFPVLGPLLTPFESPTAARASFWLKAVFGLWGWTHGSSLIRQPLLRPASYEEIPKTPRLSYICDGGSFWRGIIQFLTGDSVAFCAQT